METEHRGADSAGPSEARAVSMPMATFVATPVATPVAMPVARLVTTRVAAERTGWAYSLFEVEVEPDGGEGPHIQHREDEYLYVLEGRFSLLVEDDASEVGPGTHVYVPKGTLHAYQNAGGRTGRMLVVHTPGGPQESFVEAAGEPVTGAASSARTSPEGFGILAAEHGIEICGSKQTTVERSF